MKFKKMSDIKKQTEEDAKYKQSFKRKVLAVRLAIVGCISFVAYASGLYDRVGLLVSAVFVVILSIIFMLMLIPPSDES